MEQKEDPLSKLLDFYSFYIKIELILAENKEKAKFADMEYDFSKEEPLKYMEYIANELKKTFPEMKKVAIMKKLYQVSGSFEDLYLALTDEKNYGYLCFTEEDDNIVLNSDTMEEDFKKLIKEKGFDRISRRKEFLTKSSS